MPWSDRIQRGAFCVEAWLAMPLLAIALRLAPGFVLRRMRQIAARPHPAEHSATAVAAAVLGAAAWLPARVTTCLPRACAARVMLARRGLASDLRIGVVKTPHGSVTAHAWVEAGGIDIGLDATGPSFGMLPVR